ncbi:hypothetical protein PoB_004535900 [Plakobranchus ocellatus]|uniref:Uncharacterized protein n=1 Tax=Plakobranchus ocellatus TaxID=259542 RepID=A0AAV4BKK6_9GAST|nr:hypothetical protein PoB_004535900 [Plakobranchus ocellatus]
MWLIVPLTGHHYRLYTDNDNYSTYPERQRDSLHTESCLCILLGATEKKCLRTLLQESCRKDRQHTVEKNKKGILKWKDKHEVSLITTLHDRSEVTECRLEHRDQRPFKIIGWK